MEVVHRVVYGKPEEIPAKTISTSLLERQNLTLRQNNALPARKTLAFSKDEDELRAQMVLYVAYANLVHKHAALRQMVDEPVFGKVRRKWAARTPLMAAGCTNHVWSLRELLPYQHYETLSH